ncbi:DNA polymerase III subunit gamma and tau [Gordonia sp. MP11Mi]|uniref:DNA polymerase III subunit gamma/tau n=1 Tax=Gordonia sp. MP11Mi TaxID=3022769 RepID=A0AA97GWB9_9ACTN
MALYRTYRPATFAEVVGQEHVTEPLSRALDSGRINHAYLFSGPRGCGKTSSARILARSLNCAQGPTSTPCGTCGSCVALGPGGPGSLDVVELDAASHGGVDDTRDLRDRAFYAPAESRYRVFIIDEAHMVSSAGFNALLKIVEEPPEHLIFIFATTEPEKVLTTIKSRTHHYPFRLLAPPVMRGLLENICAQEDVTVAPEVYPLVIRAGGGSPRDSLSILDQLLAGAGDEGVTYDRALSLLGVTDSALIDAAVDALAASDGAALFGVVEKVVDAGHDPRRFAIDLLDRFRDLILLQAVPDAADRGLVEAPEDQLVRMKAVVEHLGAGTLTRYAEVAHASLGDMRGTTSPRLLLEVMCSRMLLPAVSADDAALLQRIEMLEHRPAGAGPAPADTAAAQPSSAAVAAPDGPAPRFVRPSQRKAVEQTEETKSPTAEVDESVRGQAASEPAPVPEPEPLPAEPLPAEPLSAVGVPEPTAAQAPQPDAPQREPDVPQPEGRQPQVTRQREAPTPVVERGPSRPEPPTQHTVPEAHGVVVPEAHGVVVPEAHGVVVPEAHGDVVVPGEPAPSQDPYDDIPLPPEPPTDVPPEPYGVVRRTPEPEPEPVAEPEAVAEGLTVQSVSTRWPDIRSAVRSQSSVLEAMLSSASVHDVVGTEIVLGHPHTALVGRLSDERGLRTLTTAVVEVFGPGHSVSVVQASPDAPRPSATSSAAEPQKRQTFTRPSRPQEEQAPEPEPEPEPEPAPLTADEDLTDAERAEMVEQAHDASPDPRLDPHQVAVDLMTSELGARPLE